jgi:magnesium transporter
MLTAYRDSGKGIRASEALVLPKEIIWIDLMDPSDEERAFVEARSKVHLPSKEALSEIEISSRLIAEDGLLYLSTPLISGPLLDAQVSPVGFVLCPDLLITIRYATLGPFEAVVRRVEDDLTLANSVGVFTALLEAVTDRGADVLELLGGEIDRISRSVFKRTRSEATRDGPGSARMRETLTAVGSVGDRVSQTRDVLLGVGRIASFSSEVGREWITAEFRTRLSAVAKDVSSLNDYEAHLSNKVQFLLDAVLGYISIEQNDIFRILTIASVVGIPPTLLAGIWGMNFKGMPELDWSFGYPLAWFAIVMSAVLPMIWFKVKGWF